MSKFIVTVTCIFALCLAAWGPCTPRQLHDSADAVDGAAKVAPLFGPGGQVAALVLTALGLIIRKLEKRCLDKKLETEREQHALTKRQLQEYTNAETMNHHFGETDKYTPTESEIIAKVMNGEQEVKCVPGVTPKDHVKSKKVNPS